MNVEICHRLSCGFRRAPREQEESEVVAAGCGVLSARPASDASQIGDFHFAVSENSAAGTRRRFRAGGENAGISVHRHPVLSLKNSNSDAASLASAAAGSNPRHLRPLFSTALAPSAMA